MNVKPSRSPQVGHAPDVHQRADIRPRRPRALSSPARRSRRPAPRRRRPSPATGRSSALVRFGCFFAAAAALASAAAFLASSRSSAASRPRRVVVLGGLLLRRLRGRRGPRLGSRALDLVAHRCLRLLDGVDQDDGSAGGLDLLARGGREAVRVHGQRHADLAVTEDLDRMAQRAQHARGQQRLGRDLGAGLEARRPATRR